MWLVALCAAGVMLGRIQNAARVAGRADTLSRTVRTFVEVPGAPIGRWTQGVSSFFGSMGRAEALEAENRRLRQLSQVAEMYSETLQSLTVERDQLRKLLGASETPGKTRIPARVIGFFPLENRLTIDVGTNKSVKAGLPVISADGLVGVVQTADPRSAQVQLLSSPRPFIIGAKVVRDPPALGFLHGEALNRLTVEFTDIESPFRVGDWVVTSGLSEYIPEGIRIGQIVQTRIDEAMGTRTAQVFPAVAIGNLTDVLVLK